MNGHDAKASPMPAVRTVSAGAPLTWLARGFADFRAHPLPSLFYGACFALMGWLIAVVFEHAAAYVSSLVTGFFLVGPFLATGLYALSRRRERGEPAWLAPPRAGPRPRRRGGGGFGGGRPRRRSTPGARTSARSACSASCSP